MFLKAKDMQALMRLATEMKMQTVGEAMTLLKTLQSLQTYKG